MRAEEGVETDVDAGEDGSAEVLPVARDGFERGGRPEVDHDGRPTEEVVGRNRIGDPVGADFLGIVIEDRDTGLDARLDDECVEPEVALRHRPEGPGDPGNRRTEAQAGDVAVPAEPMEPEELLDDQGVLVGRAFGVGGDPPVVEQTRVGCAVVALVLTERVEADHGLGVADVDGEQVHESVTSLGSRSRPRSKAGAERVTALVDTMSAPVSA